MSERLRVIDHKGSRIETGPLQFGMDWPGIFIRGDSSFGYAIALSNFLRDPRDAISRLQVESLLDLLRECDMTRQSVPSQGGAGQ